MGIVVLLITGYFIYKANYHMENDQDGMALLKLCLGMFVLFMMAAVLL